MATAINGTKNRVNSVSPTLSIRDASDTDMSQFDQSGNIATPQKSTSFLDQFIETIERNRQAAAGLELALGINEIAVRITRGIQQLGVSNRSAIDIFSRAEKTAEEYGLIPLQATCRDVLVEAHLRERRLDDAIKCRLEAFMTRRSHLHSETSKLLIATLGEEVDQSLRKIIVPDTETIKGLLWATDLPENWRRRVKRLGAEEGGIYSFHSVDLTTKIRRLRPTERKGDQQRRAEEAMVEPLRGEARIENQGAACGEAGELEKDDPWPPAGVVQPEHRRLESLPNSARDGQLGIMNLTNTPGAVVRSKRVRSVSLPVVTRKNQLGSIDLSSLPVGVRQPRSKSLPVMTRENQPGSMDMSSLSGGVGPLRSKSLPVMTRDKQPESMDLSSLSGGVAKVDQTCSNVSPDTTRDGQSRAPDMS